MKNDKMRRRCKRAEIRQMCIHILGGKCNKCGITESLQFDHINPQDKITEISNLYLNKYSILMYELSKCQLLCVACHKAKTALELRAKQLGTGKHGTMWMYHKHKCRCIECTQYKRTHRLKYIKGYLANPVIAVV